MRFRNSTQKRKNRKRTLCLLSVLFILFQTGAAAKAVSQTPQDSTTFHGNDLGENELRVSGGTSEENPYAFVLCQKLNVYTQKDTDSEVASLNTAVTMKSLRKTKKWFSSASIRSSTGLLSSAMDGSPRNMSSLTRLITLPITPPQFWRPRRTMRKFCAG